MRESLPPAWHWALRGAGALFSVPVFILLTSMAGFGVLCRETGLTLGQSVFMTAAVWALPSQLVLVGAIAAGASLPAASVSVALSAIRFVPMIASWVPMLNAEGVSRWRIALLSHSVAVTAWVVAALRLPKLPAPARLPYYTGFAIALVSAGTFVTGVSFIVAGALPPIVAGMLFFLTPVYFLVALSAAARINAERFALAAGLVLGPLFRFAGFPLDLVWAGVIGGTLGYAGHRLLARRA
jgi:predicted branched-subunit amino acid permease